MSQEMRTQITLHQKRTQDYNKLYWNLAFWGVNEQKDHLIVFSGKMLEKMLDHMMTIGIRNQCNSTLA
jgi:hypothetical protein